MSVQRYDPATKIRFTWRKLAGNTRERGRIYEATVILVGDSVYWATAGAGLWVFSRRSLRWNHHRKYLRGLTRLHVAELANDKIYYFYGDHIPIIVEYDIVRARSKGITTFKKGPLGREFMSTVFAPWRKEIITFGGFVRRGGRSNETHGLNIESRTWTKLKLRGKQPEPRTVHAAALRGTKMYIFGGFTTGDRLLSDLWVAELGNFCAPYWSRPQIEGLTPAPRSLAALNNLNGVLVLFGGYPEERRQTELQTYLAEENWWYESSGSTVEVHGEPPERSGDLLGVTTSEGILYFTTEGIFLLSRQ